MHCRSVRSGRKLDWHGFVYILGSTNLALDKPAWQSSIWEGGLQVRLLMGNADRNAQHGHCADTVEENNPWWIVDLQSEYIIAQILITDRTDFSGKFYYLIILGIEFT